MLTPFQELVNRFDLDASDAESPAIGFVEFSGCALCTAAQSASVLYPLTSDPNKLATAIANRAPPSSQMPMTCISCGLDVARSLLSSMSRPGGMPLVLLLTDGEQSILGGDAEAEYASGQLKAQGVDLVALGLGETNVLAMESMASHPVPSYFRTAEDVNVLLNQARQPHPSAPPR